MRRLALAAATCLGVLTLLPHLQARAMPAPGDGDAWTAWVGCTSAHCDDAAVAQLRKADPGNAALWIIDVERADAKHDTAAIDAALARVARGTHYDAGVYAHARANALARLATGGDSPQAARRVIEHFEVEMAVGSAGAVNSLYAACTGHAARSHARRATCVRIGRLLQASTTVDDVFLGSVLIADNADTSAQVAAAQHTRDLAYWQQRQFRDDDPLNDCSGRLTAVWGQALRTSATQALFARAILAARHITLAPPPHWVPTPPRPPSPPWATTDCHA